MFTGPPLNAGVVAVVVVVTVVVFGELDLMGSTFLSSSKGLHVSQSTAVHVLFSQHICVTSTDSALEL